MTGQAKTYYMRLNSLIEDVQSLRISCGLIVLAICAAALFCPALADTQSDIDALLAQARKDNGDGNTADAEIHLRQALSISADRLGAMASTTGNTSRKLADFYMNRGRYSEAEHYLQRALVIAAKYSVAVSDSNGEFQNVRGFLNESVRNPQSLPGSIEVAETLGGIANLYSRMGRYPDSERIFKRVIQIYQNGGENAGSVLYYTANSKEKLAETQLGLAQAYYHEGNVVEAENMFKSYVSTVREDKGQSRDLAEALAHLAAFYKSQSRNSDADAIESESKDILTRYR